MKIRTSIATSDAGSITVRGHDLVNELIGKVDFTAMVYRNLAGRFPTEAEARLLDACLVTLMEHGITPSSLIARLVADNLPGETQVAIAAGLNAVGPVFVGTMEGCGRNLKAIVDDPDPDRRMQSVIEHHQSTKTPLPGFGHPFHKPDDPRTPRLFALAEEVGLNSGYCETLRRMNDRVDAVYGKHLTINATGGVAALLLEAGLDPSVFRGIAVISRSAGLLSHVREEQETHSARAIWSIVEAQTEYRD